MREGESRSRGRRTLTHLSVSESHVLAHRDAAHRALALHAQRELAHADGVEGCLCASNGGVVAARGGLLHLARACARKLVSAGERVGAQLLWRVA